MNWTKAEKELARELFQTIRKREFEKLTLDIQNKSSIIENENDIWNLREFLNEKEKEMDSKYDFRYSVLIDQFIFFINDSLLSLDEISSFSKEKKDKITKNLNLIEKLK